MQKENIFVNEMLVRTIYILFLGLLFLFGSGCVEKAKPNSFQVVHLYTDLPDSLDSTLFHAFEKENQCKVFVHHANTAYILERIKTEKYDSKVDAVLFQNGLHFRALKQQNALSNENKVNWQPLFSEPFVFRFENDTLPLFNSYGQILRNEKARVDPTFIRNYLAWGHLLPGLKKTYPIYSKESIEKKILHSDSLKGRDLLRVQIIPFSALLKKEKQFFPDQYYKGSIGIMGGIGLIRHSQNRTNGLALYHFCETESWRKKLAKELNLFPILSSEHNKTRDVILYQSPPND